MTHRDKTVAYIDRHIGDEILEIEAVDFLPRRGAPVTFKSGDGKGKWRVFDVKPTPNDSQLSALVYLDRTD